MTTCPPTLAAVFASVGIPTPVCEYRFDETRKWRFDYAWPDPRILLALEVEGGAWLAGGGRHNRGSGFMRDMEKYNRAACLGWRIIRCTPKQLASGEILGDLAEAMTWGGDNGTVD